MNGKQLAQKLFGLTEPNQELSVVYVESEGVIVDVEDVKVVDGHIVLVERN